MDSLIWKISVLKLLRELTEKGRNMVKYVLKVGRNQKRTYRIFITILPIWKIQVEVMKESPAIPRLRKSIVIKVYLQNGHY
jgi:hypothetical protein